MTTPTDDLRILALHELSTPAAVIGEFPRSNAAARKGQARDKGDGTVGSHKDCKAGFQNGNERYHARRSRP